MSLAKGRYVNPAAWDGGTWIAAVGCIAGGITWMTALWIRAGRILERIDAFGKTQEQHDGKIDLIDRRVTRLEIATEQK